MINNASPNGFMEFIDEQANYFSREFSHFEPFSISDIQRVCCIHYNAARVVLDRLRKQSLVKKSSELPHKYEFV